MTVTDNISEFNFNADNIGSCINSDEEADGLINLLKKKLEHYKNLNIGNEQTLKRLKINSNDLSSREILNHFAILQEACETESFSITEVSQSFLETEMRKLAFENKLDKIKSYEDELNEHISTLNKDIENITAELERSALCIDGIQSITHDQLDALRLKIKSYEDKVSEQINKYPWMNDPEYNLLSVQEEIKKVFKLKDERDRLKTSLESYCDLPPDLHNARLQLCNIKLEYEKVRKS